MKKLLKNWLILGFAFAVFLPNLASAATPKSTITISPFLQEVRFSADEATKDFSIEITNNTPQSQTFNLSVLDFGSLDDSGGVVFAGSDASTLVKKYGLAAWLQLGQKSLLLGPNGSAKVNATIVNDSFMTPGGHYAAIIASITSPEADDGNEISINQQLSSLILAIKAGGEKYDLKLDDISADGNWLRLPKSVNLRFSNPGNVHVVPRGVVKILSVNGQTVAKGVINEESGFVLPETARTFVVKLNSVSSVGLWPGLYRLQVDYRYDGLNKLARKEQSLFFINVAGIVKLLVVIAAVIALYRWMKKTRKSAKTRR